MSLLTDDIEKYIRDSGAFPGYTFQQGEWNDAPMAGNESFISIIKGGGLQAQEWARYPSYRILVTGPQRGAWDNAQQTGIMSQASDFVNYATQNYKSDCHGSIVATEPRQIGRTEENRPVIEINLTTRSK